MGSSMKEIRRSERYFPLFVSMKGKKCLVVGGGDVAYRKVQSLLPTGSRIVVVSPRVVQGLTLLEARGWIRIRKRSFQVNDLRGTLLVIGATDSVDVNRKVWSEATKKAILCNVVDQPALCNVLFPSVVRRGRLQIAISTGGASPAMARFIRRNMEADYGDEYALALEILWSLRRRVLRHKGDPERNRELFHRVTSQQFIDLCRVRDERKLDLFIRNATDQRISLAALGISLSQPDVTATESHLRRGENPT